MSYSEQPASGPRDVSRRTLRLTFKTSDAGVELLSVERLEMITPSQPGPSPEAAQNSGYWFELRDAEGRVLAHRLIDSNVLNSAEVHSPDGTITREFGAMRTGVFEVLLPDIGEARKAVLVGTPLSPRRRRSKRAPVSGDIADFDIS